MRINFILSDSHKDWGLGKLAEEIEFRIKNEFNVRRVYIAQSRRNTRSLNGFIFLSKAPVNFYFHQELALKAIKKGWFDRHAINIVNFTHATQPSSHYLPLNATDYLLVQNSQSKEFLSIENQISSSKILICPHPIDCAKFMKSSQKPTRDIVFVSNYYSRKKPRLIHDVIIGESNLLFTIIGKNWEKYEFFKELNNLNNFKYCKFDFESYPAELANHKVFCSLSDLEGGPVPLLESLAMGLTPLVTDTGTARDLIPDSHKHLILPVSPELQSIRKGLASALVTDKFNFKLKNNFCYDGFSNLIKQLINNGKVNT